MIERLHVLEDSDAEQVIQLGHQFYGFTGLRGNFHGNTFVTFWNGFLNHGQAAMFVWKENCIILGAIGFTLTMSLFDGKVIADETFWFVDPNHRGTAGVRLFMAARDWAQKAGATRMLMGRMLHIDPENDRVGRFYERQGLKPLQTQYYADL